MKLKTLLLGSATAVMVAGAAQAADLSVAEPVDYVRVCDAFGVGYWYIPGTDTCIKINGDVEFDATVYNQNEEYYNYEGSNHWYFNTAVYFQIHAKSMTDWGPLEGFMAFYGGGGSDLNIDETYISIGPLLAGWTRTMMTFARGGFSYNAGGFFNAEHKVNTVRLTWAMNGFGLAVAVEDPTDWWFGGRTSWGGYGEGSYYSWSSMPDVVAALTFSNAMFDAKVSGVWSETWDNAYGNGWAVAAGVIIKLDSIAPGDQLLLKGAYGAAPWVIGTNGVSVLEWYDDVDYSEPTWMVMAAFIHYLTPNFWASVTGNYISATEYNWGDYISAWQAQFALGYEAAPNFWLKPSVTWTHYADEDGYDEWSDWYFNLRIQRDFGNK